MSEAPRYRLPAIVLHWGQAVVVVWLLWLGWTMVDLPKGAERSAAYGLHKSLGVLALGLTVLRLAWRARHAPPALPGPRWGIRLAAGTHAALYGCLLAVPLAGYLASSFTPYPIKFFGIELVKLGWPDESLNGFFKSLHVTLMWGMVVLIGLHLGGVVKHLMQGDALWRRMLPGRGVQ